MRTKKITIDKIYELAKYFGWHSDGGIAIACCGFNDFSADNTAFSPPRIDQYFTIHLVVEGQGTFIINEHKYNVKQGDMFFLLPNTTVSYYTHKKNPWKYYWINVDGPQIQSYISMLNLSATHAVIPCPAFDKIKAEFENILNPNNNLISSNFSAIALFYTILSLLNTTEATTSISNTDILERVQAVVEFNYSNPNFTVPSIASMLYVSHSHLWKKFKEQTGQTLIQYLSSYRLTKACELLATKKYTNKELATLVGFNDEFHFMKMFKKKFGATIKEYQKDIFEKTE